VAQLTVGNARQWQTRHRSQHLHPQPCPSTGFPPAPGVTRPAGNQHFWQWRSLLCQRALFSFLRACLRSKRGRVGVQSGWVGRPGPPHGL